MGIPAYQVRSAGYFVCMALIASVALVVGSVRADDPTTSIAAPVKPNKLADANEIALWQADIAESSYAIRKSNKNLTSLLQAKETLIALYCFPDLPRTLRYAGAPSDPNCLKYIDSTLALDAENPYAVCARDGIDSASCSAAFAVQKTAVLPANSSLWPREEGDIDLELALDARTAEPPAAVTLQAELSRLETYSSADPATASQHAPRMRQLVKQLIGYKCKTTKLKIESSAISAADLAEESKGSARKKTDPQKAARDKALRGTRSLKSATPESSDSVFEPMDEIIKALRPDPSAEPEKIRTRTDGVTRTRYISVSCNALITRALKFDPGSSAAVCARDGEYTPQCIQSRRRERSQAERQLAPRQNGTPQTPAPRGKNFSTF